MVGRTLYPRTRVSGKTGITKVYLPFRSLFIDQPEKDDEQVRGLRSNWPARGEEGDVKVRNTFRWSSTSTIVVWANDTVI